MVQVWIRLGLADADCFEDEGEWDAWVRHAEQNCRSAIGLGAGYAIDVDAQDYASMLAPGEAARTRVECSAARPERKAEIEARASAVVAALLADWLGGGGPDADCEEEYDD